MSRYLTRISRCREVDAEAADGDTLAPPAAIGSTGGCRVNATLD